LATAIDKQIKKENGKIEDFDISKLKKSLNVQAGTTEKLTEYLAEEAVKYINRQFSDSTVVSTKEIKAAVVECLLESGYCNLAYIYEHDSSKNKVIPPVIFENNYGWSTPALEVMKHRYLKKDSAGNIIEEPREMFWRVAWNIAQAELNYSSTGSVEEKAKVFYNMMVNKEFMPNSPTLMNAGGELQMLIACFVIPVPDSMEGILDAAKAQGMIQKSGGGTGMSFGDLRPKGDFVGSTQGVSSGPVSFMQLFDAVTNTIKQGGKRRGANMGVLPVNHPDILDFIVCKIPNSANQGKALENFNISVAITDEFMERVKSGEDFDLINPRDHSVVGSVDARDLFGKLVYSAWLTGDPGILFIDRINEDNFLPKLGDIKSSNPCGEQNLHAWDACNLGSINLAEHMVQTDGRYNIDWGKLGVTVRNSVNFLDNVIDMSEYPVPEIQKMVKANRRIGLGIMGWHDVLIYMEIPYASDRGVALAEKVMRFISDKAREASSELAESRGNFPNYEDSLIPDLFGDIPMRNSYVNTIAPTGTTGIIAGPIASGCEPYFGIVWHRKSMLTEEGVDLLEVNPLFELIAKREGFYSERLLSDIAESESIMDVEGIPKKWKDVFACSLDIPYDWHVKMQAGFQKYVDNSISKTINMKNSAEKKDVENAYFLAWELSCKGITVYRDGSKNVQVLNKTKTDTNNEIEESSADDIVNMIKSSGGCSTCETV